VTALAQRLADAETNGYPVATLPGPSPYVELDAWLARCGCGHDRHGSADCGALDCPCQTTYRAELDVPRVDVAPVSAFDPRLVAAGVVHKIGRGEL
jgi:hypothetical protein